MKRETRHNGVILGGYLVGTVGGKVLLDPWVNLVCDSLPLPARVAAKFTRMALMHQAGIKTAELFNDVDKICSSVADDMAKKKEKGVKTDGGE